MNDKYVELFLLNITDALDKSKETKLTKLISEYRLSKLKKFVFREDYLRSFYAECLLRFILCQKLELANSNINILYTKYGKPYIYGENIKFSISHSGDWVMVAISNMPVGVDIERIHHKDTYIIEKIFSSDEKKEIYENFDVSDEKHYELWTLKESYMKFTGLGFQLPLDQCEFKKTSHGYVLENYNQLQFRSFRLMSDYMISVATFVGIYVNTLNIVKPSMIYDYFWRN